MRELLVDLHAGALVIAVVEEGVLVEVHAARGREGASGGVYLGKVEYVAPGMEAAFVDIGLSKPAYLSSEDVPGEGPLRGRIKQGDELLLQINREAAGDKGARVTTRIALPGARCVLCPEDRGIGVSRRIAGDERERLRRIGEALCPPGYGMVLRTACEGITEDAMRADIDAALARWEEIGKKALRSNAPAVLDDASDLASLIGGLILPQTRVFASEDAAYHAIRSTLGEGFAGLGQEVEIEAHPSGLIGARGFTHEIGRARSRRIDLPGGGQVVFDVVEALTAIDVNTARDAGAHAKRPSVARTNLEAAIEIARQIRLRNLGGIIVIDFINMPDEEDRKSVHAAMRRAMEADRTPHDIAGFTRLGLFEISRKRSGLPLADRLKGLM